jgi:hypothetical protein
VIVTIAKVADFDQFLKTFSTKGAEKRKQHGCTGSHVFALGHGHLLYRPGCH